MPRSTVPPLLRKGGGDTPYAPRLLKRGGLNLINLSLLVTVDCFLS
jgi:hypothetical protein